MAALPFSIGRHFTIPLYSARQCGAKMSICGTKLLLTFRSATNLGYLKGIVSVLHSLYFNLNAPSQLHCVWRKYGFMMQSSAFQPEWHTPLGGPGVWGRIQRHERAVLKKFK